MLLWATLLGCGEQGGLAGPIEVIESAGGGGFAGSWSGVVIQRGGELLFWEEGPGQPRQEERRQVEPATLVALFEAAECVSWRSLGPGEPANMSETITVRGGGEERSVTWEYDAAPDEVRRVLKQVREVVRSAREHDESPGHAR